MTPPEPDRGLSQEQFDALLLWLDPLPETAGEKYERIRGKLIQFFRFRGAADPQELADRVIDRVARKLPSIREGYSGEPAHYFSGVAGKVFLEFQKTRTTTPIPLEAAEPDEQMKENYARLERCLNRLSAGDRELVLSYYDRQHTKNRYLKNAYNLRQVSSEEKSAHHRKLLADEHGLTLDNLRVRVTRIRLGLIDCVGSFRKRVTSTDTPAVGRVRGGIPPAN